MTGADVVFTFDTKQMQQLVEKLSTNLAKIAPELTTSQRDEPREDEKLRFAKTVAAVVLAVLDERLTAIEERLDAIETGVRLAVGE